ncbi:MAG: hypothetical protein JNL58_08635 [Planctomyces sp.]|nr:hypothetical protein [Planctomyces sp.]
MKRFIKTGLWKRRTATGTMLASLALLGASCIQNAPLIAVQEEAAEQPVAQTRELRIPSDISEESIEGVDAALASSISPLLSTVFNSEESAEARKAAVAELEKQISAISTTAPGSTELKTRLERRVSLMSAAINAMEVADVSPPTASSLAAVAAEAEAIGTWLKGVRNGDLWSVYLHLEELKSSEKAAGALAQVSQNLIVGEGMSDDQKAFLARPRLEGLREKIAAAVAAAASTTDEATARAELKSHVNDLVISILSYERDSLVADAEKSRAAYLGIRNRFPAAADVLRPVIMSYYFNHNLHITVSETLLSRLVSDYRTESGCIADCIMGAWVTGSQSTDLQVSADIRPSASVASFQIQVNGNTRSNTTAQKDPATVFTRGDHYFFMAKPVTFSGRSVVGGPAGISVDVNSTTTGVRTKYDGIPLFGGIINNIARKEVAKSKPQSEAVTKDRLTEEALPKFETEVGNQLRELNDTLSKTLNSLDSRGVGPESISARSSNTHIAVSSRTMNSGRLGGSVQPPTLLSPRGMAVHVHETALNNSLDALGFNGRSIPEDQVVVELEKALSDLLQRDVKLSKDEEKPAEEAPKEGEAPEPPTTFVFSKTDPIRVHFSGNQIVLILRTGVQQEGKEEIPEQEITVPIGMSVSAGKLVMEPSEIKVSSREETNRAKQVTRAAQIRRILNRRIVRREIDATFDLQAAGDKSLPLTLTLMELADGWLTAEIQ